MTLQVSARMDKSHPTISCRYIARFAALEMIAASHYTAMAQYYSLHQQKTCREWPFLGWSSSLDLGLISLEVLEAWLDQLAEEQRPLRSLNAKAATCCMWRGRLATFRYGLLTAGTVDLCGKNGGLDVFRVPWIMQVEMTSFIAEVLQESESPGAQEILQSVWSEVACCFFGGNDMKYSWHNVKYVWRILNAIFDEK